MKANKKFKEEEAISAVIGVILMVALTVAIAVTVYIYVTDYFIEVSGFVTDKYIGGSGSRYLVIDNSTDVRVDISVYYQYDIGDFYE